MRYIISLPVTFKGVNMNQEDIILSKNVVIEKKKFYFDVKANNKGKYLRITEKSGRQKNKIIIPYEGLESFFSTLKNILEGNEEI